MKRINKGWVGICMLVIVLLGLSSTIMAENLTRNESINTTSIDTIVIMEDIENEEAICEEQIGVLIGEYNSLLDDFKNNRNCDGVAYTTLRNMNDQLSEERDSCVTKITIYRVGFYSMLILLVITAIIIIVMSIRIKKE